jgi:major inositol transporter-like SP family MFS transporter
LINSLVVKPYCGAGFPAILFLHAILRKNARSHPALLLIGLFSFVLPEGTGRGFVILALTVTFLAFQQGAISPVTWLMLSEIFPLKIRGLGMGASAFVLWMVNFMVGFGFPLLLAAIGLPNTFFVFAVLGVGAIMFASEYVPETRDKSLEDLEHHFKQLAAARTGSSGGG